MKGNNASRTEQVKIRQFSTFYLDETLLGVDITQVQEINEEPLLTRVPLARDYVRGIMNLRGQIITIIDLRRKMGFPPAGDREGQGGVVIVNWSNEHIGLMFDRTGDVMESAPSAIETPPANIGGVKGEFFAGVIQTGGDRIVALLDIEAVLADESYVP